jgi:hypothetical protein
MNQTEIQSKNLIIHLYMCDTEEAQKDLQHCLKHHEGFLDTLHYHDDPHWLFPVVVKILEQYNVSLAMNRFGASFKEFGHDVILVGEQGTPMDALYSSIIELLQLKFNENRN